VIHKKLDAGRFELFSSMATSRSTTHAPKEPCETLSSVGRTGCSTAPTPTPKPPPHLQRHRDLPPPCHRSVRLLRRGPARPAVLASRSLPRTRAATLALYPCAARSARAPAAALVDHRPFVVRLDRRAAACVNVAKNLIGNTANSSGIVVTATIDHRRYTTGKKVTPNQMRELKSSRRPSTATGSAICARVQPGEPLEATFA
jgi:hypothetical protein